MNQTEVKWMYQTLINPSFTIILQFIKSDSPIHFLHGVGQGTIAEVYLWIISYNIVLGFCNKKHEGARFRDIEGKIIATALAPTCVDDSILLSNEEGALVRAIDVAESHINMLQFNGSTLNLSKGCYFHFYPTNSKQLYITINNTKVAVTKLNNKN